MLQENSRVEKVFKSRYVKIIERGCCFFPPSVVRILQNPLFRAHEKRYMEITERVHGDYRKGGLWIPGSIL